MYCQNFTDWNGYMQVSPYWTSYVAYYLFSFSDTCLMANEVHLSSSMLANHCIFGKHISLIVAVASIICDSDAFLTCDSGPASLQCFESSF